MLLCWLVWQCRVEPLQPDQPEDDLGPIDISDVHRRRCMEEAEIRGWLDRG